MLIFDQLKRNDPPLRWLTGVVLGGLAVLLAGLWWVQVVRGRDYQTSVESQTLRTVRVPAVRGKILDRHGRVLAESRPACNISLYLEDLGPAFKDAYRQLRPVVTLSNAGPFWKRWLGAGHTRVRPARLTRAQVQALEWQARYQVAGQIVTQLAAQLQMPELTFNAAEFRQHYMNRRALPWPLVRGATPQQVARFLEQNGGGPALDLEVLPLRAYPLGETAAHVIGHLTRDDRSAEGELADYFYRLPDYRGVLGIEGGFDAVLRGRAGAKAVVVNHLGYRQEEHVWQPAEPGRNVVLTLDARVQQAAERALRRRVGPNARGAVVVMHVQTGDVLALVSSPAFDPNQFIPQIGQEDYARLNDPTLRPQINRATQENYAPGSIFKTVVGLACLEAGLGPEEKIYNPGHIYLGRRYIHDTAPPGEYNFRRALLRSSNTYFITNGLRCGVTRILELGRRLHLGERFELPTRQETAGFFPTLKTVSRGWFDGDTANLCIGQGRIAVTPLQMAVMTAAFANGGEVLWPRLVARIEPQDPLSDDAPVEFPARRVRDHLGVSERHLTILREAMLADTEDPEGTAWAAFRDYYRQPGVMRVCGKTGTAQVTDAHNRVIGRNLWFIAFAPYESPRYAVVVLVEGNGSGGATCAPVARDIFEALKQIEAAPAPAATLTANP